MKTWATRIDLCQTPEVRIMVSVSPMPHWLIMCKVEAALSILHPRYLGMRHAGGFAFTVPWRYSSLASEIVSRFGLKVTNLQKVFY